MGVCHVFKAAMGGCHVFTDAMGGYHVFTAALGGCHVFTAAEGGCHVFTAAAKTGQTTFTIVITPYTSPNQPISVKLFGKILCSQIMVTFVTQKIPHTGDTNSLDRWG